MWLLVWIGCQYDPDPRTIRGAMDAAARALEREDPHQLFRYLDQRAQHAMGGLVAARRQARALIEQDYPPSERPRAIAALGDGAQVESGAALFARRCDPACLQHFADRVGAPLEVTRKAQELIVRTSRGATLNVFTGTHGWFGLVWHTAELCEERDRASRELRQIEQNAVIYRRRAALAAEAPGAGGANSEAVIKAGPR